MFWKFIRSNKRKPKKLSARNLQDTFLMGEHFITVWEETMSGQPTVEDIEHFLLDLDAFMTRVESRWMGKAFKRLTRENQQVLSSLFDDLIAVNNMAVDFLNQYKRDREIAEEVESLANPDEIEGPHRSYDGWETHPYHHSNTLLEKAKKIMVSR